jgi:hypothetical protein
VELKKSKWDTWASSGVNFSKINIVVFLPDIVPRFNPASLVITPTSMYAFLSPSDGQSRILIHGNYGNHKRSKIEVGLYNRSKKGGAFKSQVTIYPYLKLTPNNAHVSLSISFISSLSSVFLRLCFDCAVGRCVSCTGSGRSALTLSSRARSYD